MKIVYFSSVSENTHRFVAKLEGAVSDPARIPLYASADPLKVDEPFVLITPTYGGGTRRGVDVPKQVIRFLNDPENRKHIRGVIAAGNMNFGADYTRGGDIVAEKCGVPVLHRFELSGTSEDVEIVNTIIERML